MRVSDADLQDLINEHEQEGRMCTTALLQELQALRKVIPQVREKAKKIENLECHADGHLVYTFTVHAILVELNALLDSAMGDAE